MSFIIDFDDGNWMSVLEAQLGDLLPPGVASRLRKQGFEYKEHALDGLESETNIEAVIDTVLN